MNPQYTTEQIDPEILAELNARAEETMRADLTQAESRQRWYSWGAQVHSGRKHSYEGTVPRAEIAKRRKKNKVAKASRKAGRK